MHAKRIKPRATDKRPAVSWAIGNMTWIERDDYYSGLFVDYGLDDALDAAAEAAGWQFGTLDHGKEGPRPHWFPPAPTALYILIGGVPYTSMVLMARNRQDAAACGIGCRWEKGEKSKLAVQVVFKDLVPHGFVEPLLFAVSSTQTDDLLAALLAHNTVLDRCEMLANKKVDEARAAAKASAEAAGKKDYDEKKYPYRQFDFWEWALPIAPGKSTARGKEQTYRVRPLVCVHPEEPGLDYLRDLFVAKEVRAVVRERAADITEWATQYSFRDGNPTDDGGEEPQAAA
jgi:hypothetical protein